MTKVRLAAAIAATLSLAGCSVEWRTPPEQRGTKMSEFPVAHDLDGTETVIGLQDGRNVRIPVKMLARKE